MTSDIDLLSFPATAQKIFSPEAPAPLRLLAARGVLPGLKPVELVQAIAYFADGADAQLSETARATLAKLPAPILTGALSADLPGSVIDKLARAYPNQYVAELLRMPRILRETLEYMAETADDRNGELVATNEQLMLANPTVIERLYMNKSVRMSTADRLIELAVRHGLELGMPAYKEAAQAIRNELIPEATEEPSFDDVLFLQAEHSAHQVGNLDGEEDTFEVDDEGEERVREKYVPLHAIVLQLSVSQKIRRATLGTASERLLLIRDPNRLVSQAAAKSPLMRDNEAAQISASRAVSEDVLRLIAQNKEFTRRYQVKFNLVTNPRTPFTFAFRFLAHLRDTDVRLLTKSKNVSGAIVQAAQQQMSRKQGKGNKA